MEIERQAIERRDFPISRRGYDPASVDAHLRGIADRVEQLATHVHAEPTLASAAGTQVQSIIASAESAAAEIRQEAHADAARAREHALADVRARVAAVSAAADALLERVTAADDALKALLETAHAAAAQLGRDLDALEGDVGGLLGAAGAPGYGAPGAPDSGPGGSAPAARREFPVPTEVPGSRSPETASQIEPSGTPVPASPLASAPSRPITAGAPAPAVPSQPPDAVDGDTHGVSGSPLAQPAPPGEDAGDGDLDSARLVALNMALGGEARADTERYLAENFTLADPLKLVDEVYAAIDS